MIKNETLMKKNKELSWLRDNQKYISIRSIAKEIGWNYQSFYRWINGGLDGNLRIINFPERCVEPLQKLLKEITAYYPHKDNEENG